MGSGSYSVSSFADYSRSSGKSYDFTTHKISGQVYHSKDLKSSLNPKNVIRECCNSKEHPNTIPVILALDVTGSMGRACLETAEALSQIMKELYEKFKDVELCVMGVGDFEAADEAPLQVSQFESDVRIAKQLDDLWLEYGGGGNRYESYTAPWFFGLYRTKLDCFDKQGRKGIIITMGDEPLNPSLPREAFMRYIGTDVKNEQIGSLDTRQLYEDASKKFDIFHIAVDDPSSSYSYHKEDIAESFGKILGDKLRVSTINRLGETICKCIEESISSREHLKEDEESGLTEDGKISW